MSESEKRRLLVVDDELEALELLKDYLTMEGFDVATAENADRALQHLAGHDVDLIVTDIRMPGMSGVELTKRVKASKPRIGIIINTAYLGLYGDDDVRKSGADDFVQKPFNLSELRERIDRVLFQMDTLKLQE